MRCRICSKDVWEPVARAPDLRFVPRGPSYDVLRCTSCGVMATAAEGDFVDAAGHYPDAYGAFGAGPERATALARRTRHRLPGLPHVAPHRLAWLAELPVRADLRVLEVGCATGKISLALAAARGWQVAGIEPAAAAAEQARARGLETHVGTLDDYAGSGGFDAVLFVHVLEHLPDPLAALVRARELLAPGGRVVVALPNAEGRERRLFGDAWDGWDLPRHVHHFGPAALCALLARAGLAAGPVRHEWYSLLARSARNRRRFRDSEASCDGGALKWLEPAWGLLLAAVHSSSALQVVATRT